MDWCDKHQGGYREKICEDCYADLEAELSEWKGRWELATAELAECHKAREEAERQWAIQGKERLLLEQARYTSGGELDQMTELRKELAEFRRHLGDPKG